jgi:predicted peptidase
LKKGETMKIVVIGLSAGILILAGCANTKESPAMEGKQEGQMIAGRVTIDVHAGYLLYLPDGYGKGETKWPLVLFLHGSGERGTDLELVKRHGPPKLVAAGKKFPFILVSPQCSEDEYWSVPTLKLLLDRVLERYKVDHSRIYLTGLSRGGNGTWKLAIAYPDLFAAIAPICGWGDSTRVSVLKGVPTWVFHGKKDSTVAFERGESMARHLKAAGGNVRFTVYPEAGHDCWTETYQNPEFYEWLLGQKKGG